MSKVCIRCDYQRQATDLGPISECPRCGIIYERAEATARDSGLAVEMRNRLRESQAARAGYTRDDGSTVRDFFAFRTMLAPTLVKVWFVLNTVALLAAAFLTFKATPWSLPIAVLSLLALRVVLEAIIVMFRIYESIEESLALQRNQLAELKRIRKNT